MRWVIASLAMTFLFVPSGISQEQQETRCRVRFAVVQREDNGTFKIQPDDRDLWGQWPEDAREWWAKDGSRKFAELCEAARTDADFVVTWEKQPITKNLHRITGTRRTPVYRTVCEPRNGRLSRRSRRGCWQVVSYYQESLLVKDQRVRLDRLSVTLYQAEGDPQQFVPLSSLAKEKYPDRGIGKAAFESALKALRKEARKSRRR
jgi:hypothetical protein